MSAESWRAEFYPVKADTVTESEATAHSLRKWIGARPENLERHGVRFEDGRIVDADGKLVIAFSSHSCALCNRFYDGELSYENAIACRRCPLFKARDGYSCVDARPDENEYSPFDAIGLNAPTPEPMIHWLEKTIEYERGGK